MSTDQLTCEAGNVKATDSCPRKASSYSNTTSISGKSGRRTDTGSRQPSSRHFHQCPGRDVSEGCTTTGPGWGLGARTRGGQPHMGGELLGAGRGHWAGLCAPVTIRICGPLLPHLPPVSAGGTLLPLSQVRGDGTRHPRRPRVAGIGAPVL